ncbi:MAG: fumarate hydratase [Planctomycetes bacterium SM23_32]|nr:MAG: fumarate hydratase [Planctomycetes bacterium SM23_32]
MDYVSVIEASDVAEAVCDLYRRISTELRPDVVEALRSALEREDSEPAREVLRALLENAEISRADGVPLCQDTGLVVAFVKLGARVVLAGGSLQEALDEGVRRAVGAQPLRASTVESPLGRRNTGGNTPAVVHVQPVEGDALTIHLLAKGGGAENVSRLHMLTPADGRAGVLKAIVLTVDRAGADACPPLVVGVGLGGNFEQSALLSKRALLRDLREPNPDAELATLEREALERVNGLGIGPQGFGGRPTALAVLIAQAPCHIASLPVAVNLECHSHRHGAVTLHGRPRRLGGA